jgi:hypothetical protein
VYAAEPIDDPIRQDPTVARVRAMLDPEALAAVDDVDRTLIVAELKKDPWVRVRESAANATYLQELRACLTDSSKR